MKNNYLCRATVLMLMFAIMQLSTQAQDKAIELKSNISISNLDMDNYPTITMTFWSKASSSTTYNRIIDNDNGGYDRAVVSHNGEWVIFNDRYSPTGIEHVLNEWTHVAAVFTTSATKLYLNGVLAWTGAGAYVLDGSSALSLGDGYRGELDDLSLWSYELTLAEIGASMYGGYQGDEDYLIAYYDFDDSSVTDKTANNYDGIGAGADFFLDSYAKTKIVISNSDPLLYSGEMTWEAPSQGASVEGYYLDIDDDEDFSSPLINNLDLGLTTAYQMSNLCAGTTYYQRIRAYGSSESSNYFSDSYTTADYSGPFPVSASLPNLIDLCSVNEPTAPTATDKCNNIITGVHQLTFPITAQRETTIVWTYTDEAGNTITQEQNVIIQDDAAPVADAESLPTLTSQCSVSEPEAPTATDNCSGTVTGTHQLNFPITAQGETTIVWTFIDSRGNTSTQSQLIIIEDTDPPIPNVANLPHVADLESVSLAAPTATDACLGTVLGTTETLFPITSSGITEVVWTYNDGNGNTATQSQFVAIGEVPENDLCTDAISITEGELVTGTFKNALPDAEDLDCATREDMGPEGVWYSFIGTGTQLSITTNYETGIFGINVLEGSCGEELTCVSSNSSGPTVLFETVLGQDYLIFISEFISGPMDSFSFTLSSLSTNISCEEAISVGLEESVVGNSFGLSTDPVGPRGEEESPEEEGVWYHFLGTGDIVQFKTIMSRFSYHDMTIYEGGCEGEVIEGPGGPGGPGGGPEEPIEIEIKQNVDTKLGIDYQIKISPSEGVGSFEFVILPGTPPINDKCINAIILSCGDVVSGNTEFATSDEGQASTCGSNSDIGLGVWYRFIGTGEKINLSTCNDDSYDTSLSVYSGACSTGLVCVAGNEDALGCPNYSSMLSFNAELGKEYLILVDGYSEEGNDEVGAFSLEITCEEMITPPVNDTCSDVLALTVFEEGAGTPTVGTNVGALAYNGYLDCDEYATANDVWYSFNSGYNTSIAVTATFETAGYLFYAIYDACGGEAIECIAEYDYDEEEDMEFPVEITDFTFDELDTNTDYLIQVWNSSEAGTFTLILNDGENSKPYLDGDDEIQISRYAPEGEVLTAFDYKDEDGHDQRFEISEGNDDGFFQIDEITGEFSVADVSAFQSSEANSFELTIRLNDQGPGEVFAETSLTVTVVDDQYPTLADATISRDERVSHLDFDFAYEFLGESPDEDGVIYSIVNGDEDDVFYVDGSSLKLTEYGYFDGFNYEFNTQFILTIEISDDTELGLSTYAALTINLNDVNERPEASAVSAILNLNSANGTSVGFMQVEDEDKGQTHSFAINSGNETGIFTVNSTTGELTVADAAALLSGGDNQYSLGYVATDNGEPALTSEEDGSFIVQVQTNPMVTVFEIDEDAENNEIVGQVVFDAEADISYSLDNADEDALFSMLPNGEISVNNSDILNFEEQSSVVIYISAVDNGTESTLFSGLAITINILDVNEAPELVSLEEENFYLFNSAKNGDVLLQVAATDPESDDLTYSLVNDERFEINASTGVVTVKDMSKVPFFEESSVMLGVVVSDGELEDNMDVNVNLVINAYPTLLETTFSTEENVAAGTLIATLSSDDVHGIESFEMISGNAGGTFLLDQKTGELTLAEGATLDFETKASYDLVIAITDNGPGNLISGESVSIQVINVQESVVIADIAAKEVVVEEELKFQIKVTTDVSNTPVTYTLDETTKSKGMLVSESGKFSWTPTVAQVGATSVTIIVSDGENIDKKSVAIRVSSLNEVVIAGLPALDKTNIFPNPVISAFQLSGEQPDQLFILDLKGKILVTFESPQTAYDIRHLESGIYLMGIRKGEVINYTKLIKK